MKTRIIYPKMWEDKYIRSLSRDEKLLYVYFITNEKVNLTGIYELSDAKVMFDLGFTEKALELIKGKFHEDNKIVFFEEFVRIINYDKYNNYTGIKNDVAKEKERQLAPDDILVTDTLSIPYRYFYNTNHNINTNTNTNTKKSEKKESKKEYLKSEECFQELYKTFPLLDEKAIRDECVVIYDWLSSKGKVQKDYIAFARNWIRNSVKNGKIAKKRTTGIDKNNLPEAREKPVSKEAMAKLRKDVGKLWGKKTMN